MYLSNMRLISTLQIAQVNNEQPVSKSKSKYDGLLDADDVKNI
jgi:hypothetical protein